MKLPSLNTEQFFHTRPKWLVPIALIVIIGVAAYLRLWHIGNWFHALEDYDPAVYMLSGRLITQGHLPYIGFVLVQPPFYPVVLAGVTKVFGYSFVYGQYLSVVLSLASVLLIYLAGKQLLGRLAGIVAAALFAVSPDMVYNGRRSAPEALGVFLVLVGTYLAAKYLRRGRTWLLFAAGLAFGLGMATKYTFVPIFVGVLLVTAVTVSPAWRAFRKLVQPSFLLTYFSFALAIVGMLFLLSRVMGMAVPVPFFWSTFDGSSTSTALLAVASILVLPFILAILTTRVVSLRGCCAYLWRVVRQRTLWWMTAGAGAGFLAVTGYFIVRAPNAFLLQTIEMQRRYLTAIPMPSFLGLVRSAADAPDFTALAYLPVLLSLPIALVVLNRRFLSRGVFFLAACVLGVLVFSQPLGPEPRYYVSIYPFFLMLLSSVVPRGRRLLATRVHEIDPRVRARVLPLLATFVVFVPISLVLLANYTGYDYGNSTFVSSTQTKEVYQETAAYLESVSAKKVWAVDPVFLAIDPRLPEPLNVDSYATLFLEGKTPSQVFQEQKAEGVDYVILDCWTRNVAGPNGLLGDQLAEAVRANGRMVKVIRPEYPVWTEIWRIDGK